MPAPTWMPGSPLLQRKLGKNFFLNALLAWHCLLASAECNIQYTADPFLHTAYHAVHLLSRSLMLGNCSLAEGALSCAAGRLCSRFPMLVSPQSFAPKLHQCTQSLQHSRANFLRRNCMLGNLSTPPPAVAVSLTGIRAGVPLIVAYTLISMWTVHLLNALYLEYKRSKVCYHPFSLPAPSQCHRLCQP